MRSPDYRLRYKKTLKKTGKPIIVWDCNDNKEYTTDSFELNNCNIRMYFGNAISHEKSCGATTILEVWNNHSEECIIYNEKFFGDKANLGECICENI